MNILVTGASGGMGFATCQKLVAAGYTVYGLDLQQPDDSFFFFRFLRADITDNTQLAAAFKRIKEEAGSLTAILHFTGVYDLNSLVEIPEDEFVRIFDINLFGVYRINRLFLPLLEPKGRIIITTSELAPLYPLPFTGMYRTTKTALESYAYALRMELQLLGYSVSVIRPEQCRPDYWVYPPIDWILSAKRQNYIPAMRLDSGALLTGWNPALSRLKQSGTWHCVFFGLNIHGTCTISTAILCSGS